MIRAARIQEIDEDVFVSIILRYLVHEIFDTSIPFARTASLLLGIIQKSMAQHVIPPKGTKLHLKSSVSHPGANGWPILLDNFAIRSWRADAVGALTVAPEFQESRRKCLKDLVEGLSRILEVFLRSRATFPGVTFPDLCQSVFEDVVEPAMRLHEKMQMANHHFYLEMIQFVQFGPRREDLTIPTFYDAVPFMDCINLLQNRKKFNIEKENPSPTELRMKMFPVLTVTPALIMRQYGQGDSMREKVAIRKQQCLVAWGSQEAKERLTRGPNTVIGTLLSSKERETIMARIGITG